MKKLNKVLLGFVLFCSLLLLTGCSNKAAIGPESFQSKMEKKGFVIRDITDDPYYDENFEYAIIATNNEKNYQIELYVLSTVDYAKSMFKNNKEIFEDAVEGTKSYTDVSVKNYSKYTQSDNSTYYVISRIENTLIYAKENKELKKEINEILKDLGY